MITFPNRTIPTAPQACYVGRKLAIAFRARFSEDKVLRRLFRGKTIDRLRRFARANRTPRHSTVLHRKNRSTAVDFRFLRASGTSKTRDSRRCAVSIEVTKVDATPAGSVCAAPVWSAKVRTATRRREHRASCCSCAVICFFHAQRPGPSQMMNRNAT